MWYAIQVQPHKEFIVQDALSAIADLQTYLPTLHVRPVNPRSRKRRPFFPGYLFIDADLEEVGLPTIQWMPGVVRILGCGGQPTPIPQHVIAEIQDAVDQVQQEDPLGLGRLRHGDRVRIKTGPLQGYEAMFDVRLNGRMRARILVDFLGRQTPTAVDVRVLEKI